MNVFDSSALLCFLLDEPGSDVVERELVRGGVCGAANWSEVSQKIRARDHEWDIVRALLLSYPITIEAVQIADAEAAAILWRRGSPLSLADRLCLALTERLGATVWTADAAWGTTDSVRQIR